MPHTTRYNRNVPVVTDDGIRDKEKNYFTALQMLRPRATAISVLSMCYDRPLHMAEVAIERIFRFGLPSLDRPRTRRQEAEKALDVFSPTLKAFARTADEDRSAPVDPAFADEARSALYTCIRTWYLAHSTSERDISNPERTWINNELPWETMWPAHKAHPLRRHQKERIAILRTWLARARGPLERADHFFFKACSLLPVPAEGEVSPAALGFERFLRFQQPGSSVLHDVRTPQLLIRAQNVLISYELLNDPKGESVGARWIDEGTYEPFRFVDHTDLERGARLELYKLLSDWYSCHPIETSEVEMEWVVAYRKGDPAAESMRCPAHKPEGFAEMEVERQKLRALYDLMSTGLGEDIYDSNDEAYYQSEADALLSEGEREKKPKKGVKDEEDEDDEDEDLQDPAFKQ